MCLTKTFSNKRDIIIDEYEDKGYAVLDRFMTTYSLNQEQIQAAGFIENKPATSTADIYEFHLTPMGRKYIKSIKSVDLYLIKPNCSDILAQKTLSRIE